MRCSSTKTKIHNTAWAYLVDKPIAKSSRARMTRGAHSARVVSRAPLLVWRMFVYVPELGIFQICKDSLLGPAVWHRGAQLMRWLLVVRDSDLLGSRSGCHDSLGLRCHQVAPFPWPVSIAVPSPPSPAAAVGLGPPH